jgi:large subunit ribosomal protein L30
MICIIRIRGRVGLKKEINETLNRLRLRRKYTCVVLEGNKVQLGMIKKVKDFVAFGKINDKTFEKLIEERVQLIDKKNKVDLKKVVEELKKGKKFEELNLKPFFRLHPPRKGINSKLHFPKGVLGDNKEKINDLVILKAFI